MRPLYVLLIEDDQDTCLRFKAEIEEKEDITLIGITNNSYRALELIQEYTPDAIILDLELHQGEGNGLELLEGLRNLSLPHLPYILVTTNNSSSTTYQYAREHGTDFIMCKYQEGYSEKKAVEFLCMMSSIILTTQKKENPSHSSTPETTFQKKQRLRRLISKELDYVGISQKAVGYQYLIDAILIVIDEPTHNLTTIIAQKYHKTNASVERAMQNAINRAWNTMDINALLSHYTAAIRSSKGVPTITEFIYFYANKMKNEHCPLLEA